MEITYVNKKEITWLIVLNNANDVFRKSNHSSGTLSRIFCYRTTSRAHVAIANGLH